MNPLLEICVPIANNNALHTFKFVKRIGLLLREQLMLVKYHECGYGTV